jgi:hypothetical protein
MRARYLALAASAALLLASCQSSPPPAPRKVVGQGPRAEEFDPRGAWAHVEALAAIGPRPMGSEGAAEARSYLRRQLEKLGLEIVEQRVGVSVGDAESFDVVNLAGRIPGESDDSIVIATGYDTRVREGFEYLGVNEAASGPAVALEMARVLRHQPLPYTTWVVFLDGEAPLPDGPSAHYGARALGMRLAQEDVLEQIRLALVIGSVCDPELHIARDLRSERIYREEFWRAAARLGHGQAFGRAEFESPDAGHISLGDAGLRRVVALVDTSFGGNEPPGVYAGTADDDLEHCSADSLGVVGSVSLEALGTIGRRLAKIDRVAESPVSEAQALAWDTLSKPPEVPEAPEGTQESPDGAPVAEATPGAAPEAAAPTPEDPAEVAVPTAEGSEEVAAQAAPEAPPAPASSEAETLETEKETEKETE